MALLDAGVPISKTVGGVACGLIARCGSGDKRGDITEHRVLTDLLVRSHCTWSCSGSCWRRVHDCDVASLALFSAPKGDLFILKISLIQCVHVLETYSFVSICLVSVILLCVVFVRVRV